MGVGAGDKLASGHAKAQFPPAGGSVTQERWDEIWKKGDEERLDAVWEKNDESGSVKSSDSNTNSEAAGVSSVVSGTPESNS